MTYIDTLTATCRGGVTVGQAANALLKILLDTGISQGFVIHNDKKYEVAVVKEVQ